MSCKNPKKKLSFCIILAAIKLPQHEIPKTNYRLNETIFLLLLCCIVLYHWSKKVWPQTLIFSCESSNFKRKCRSNFANKQLLKLLPKFWETTMSIKTQIFLFVILFKTSFFLCCAAMRSHYDHFCENYGQNIYSIIVSTLSFCIILQNNHLKFVYPFSALKTLSLFDFVVLSTKYIQNIYIKYAPKLIL